MSEAKNHFPSYLNSLIKISLIHKGTWVRSVSPAGLLYFRPQFELLYFAMCNAHVFAQILEGTIRMRIIPGCSDYTPWL